MQAESPDLGTPVLFAGTELPAHVVLPQLSEHHPTVTPISRLSRDLLRLGYTIVAEVYTVESQTSAADVGGRPKATASAGFSITQPHLVPSSAEEGGALQGPDF